MMGKEEKDVIVVILVIAGILRLIFVGFGYVQDAIALVKYTDVDYSVYHDAAFAVSQGLSPYDRATYRYTPLLAYVLLPNVWISPVFGKLLFVLSDLAVGYLLFTIANKAKTSRVYPPWMIASLWLFNPMAMTISTRGNADTLVCLLVLLVIHFLSERKIVRAALVYGLAVHFKIYPIVFAPSFLIYFSRGGGGGLVRRTFARKRMVVDFVDAAQFSIISGTLFLLLCVYFYVLYGWTFLYETYLYHFIRADHRHNFSVYFYDMYLRNSTPSGDNDNRNGSNFLLGLFAFVPQILVQGTISYRFALPSEKSIYDLSSFTFCIFVQTMAFVTFNKVCTAQYFVWSMSLMPLAFIRLEKKASLTAYIGLAILWFGTELHWLYWAYRLEFKGETVFFMVFFASILFFFANVICIKRFMRDFSV